MIRKEHKWISEIDGKPITAHAYYFSPEEKGHLRKILKEHEEPRVEAFIRSVEMYVDYTRRILDHSYRWKRTLHRKKLSATIKHYEAAKKDTLKICSGRFQVLPPRQCDVVNYYGKETENLREKVRRDIVFANSFLPDHIEELIIGLRSALELEKVKRGDRHKADEFLLAFQIAQAFKKHVGVPRPYSGPFPIIVGYCFGMAGIKGADRSRAVRQALLNPSRI